MKKGPGPARNITDPDLQLMPVRGGGFLQGYNAQNVTSADGLIIATELTQDTTGTARFGPILAAALAAALITVRQPPRAGCPAGPGSTDAQGSITMFLADAGYCCSEDNLTLPGPDRLIATGKHRDLEKRARARACASPGASPRAGPPPRWLPGSPPKKASPPTASAATSPRPPTATSTTCGSVS